MKNKKLVGAVMGLVFLCASCSVFNKAAVAGIVKTVNGGADWQFSNAVKGNPKLSLSSLGISKLDFDPQSRETVFASTYTDGMFKSEDSGASWSKILSKIFVYDFAINPSNSKIIYAAGYFGTNGNVLKTTDGGSSWEQVYNEPTAGNVVRSVALNSKNPNQVVIGTATGAVISSSDGGLSWHLVKNLDDQINKVFWVNGNIYAVLKTKGLYKTLDTGSDFVDITSSLGKTFSINNLNYRDSIGVFSQAYIDPISSSLIYLTTDKGLYKSTDGGKTWNHVALPVKAGDAQTKAIAVAKTSTNLVFTSVGSTVFKSTDGGANWQTQSITSTGFVNYILIDPQLPQIVYGGIYSTQ